MARVTGILADAGVICTEWFTDESRDRGTATHLACRYLDEGRLDWGSVEDPVVLLRLGAYRDFLLDKKPEYISIEEQISHPVYQYTGTPDRISIIDGRKGILDIKSSSMPWHALQLAAYAACFEEPMARWTLILRDNETYRLDEHTSREDYKVWLACLTLNNWRLRNE